MLRQVMRHYDLPYGIEEVNIFVMAWVNQEYGKIEEQYQRADDPIARAGRRGEDTRSAPTPA